MFEPPQDDDEEDQNTFRKNDVKNRYNQEPAR